MENKITIIEGPTPTFELIEDNFIQGSATTWTAGILEGPYLFDVAFTTLRTFNSQALVDRCLSAWSRNQVMFLEFRDRVGLTRQTPILAARSMRSEEGDLLFLWVRQLQQDDINILTDEDLIE